MAADLSGKDIALAQSTSQPGRFDFDWVTSGPNKGNPRMTNDRAHAVGTTIISWKRGTRPGSETPEGGYYWDTAGRRGTLLWTILYDRQATRSQLIAAAQDGGQQLVTEKILTGLQAEAQRKSPGKWSLAVTYTLPSGQAQTLVL